MPRPTGKGAGYGGPARGEGNRGAPGIGRPRADVAPIIAMAKAERIERLKEHLIGLALTAEREADQITATLGYLKHEDGPAQRVELSGANGGPMQTKVTIEIVEPQHSTEAPS